MAAESIVDEFDAIQALVTPRSMWEILPLRLEYALRKKQDELPLRRCPACNVVLLGGPVIRPHTRRGIQCPASYSVANERSLGRYQWYYPLWPDWSGRDWELEAF